MTCLWILGQAFQMKNWQPIFSRSDWGGSMGQTSSMHLLNLFANEGRCWFIGGDRMVVRRTGSSYQRRRSSTSGPWHLDLRKDGTSACHVFPPAPGLLRCRQHRWGAASWDAFAQRGSCGKLRGGSIQPLGEKKEWKKRRWQQKWFILIDFSCKNFCQVIWITGNHLSESEQIFWRFKWLTSWFLRLVEVLKS